MGLQNSEECFGVCLTSAWIGDAGAKVKTVSGTGGSPGCLRGISACIWALTQPARAPQVSYQQWFPLRFNPVISIFIYADEPLDVMHTSPDFLKSYTWDGGVAGAVAQEALHPQDSVLSEGRLALFSYSHFPLVVPVTVT